MQEILDELDCRYPCRRSQFAELLSYIGYEDEPVPPCLFLHGSSATGKTLCVKSALDRLGGHHVLVNAVECYSQKVLYETILNTLAGHAYTKTTKYNPLHRCDNLSNFILNLKGLFDESDCRPVIIAIDNAERLRDLEHNVLPVLMRLAEFCPFNVCVVLISGVIFEKFHTRTGLTVPIKIHFTQYTKDELFKILLTDRMECVRFVLRKCKTNASTDIQRIDVFSNYLNAFLSVFFRLCRDLVELKYMARLNYVKYCEPILNGGVEADDVTKLWRNICPLLKASLETLYLRINVDGVENKQRDIEANMSQLGIGTESHKILAEELTSTKTFAQNFELPFYAKYLLIAAYLASFNPAKEDKRLFVKSHGKQRKRLQQVNAKAKVDEKLALQLGPKPFTLDRLLAIFYAIIEERVGLTANLLVQISSLVSLRLLTTSASDSTKYKCVVSFEFIQAISRMVGFNIKKYLYDLI